MKIEVRPIASSWELQDVYHLTHDAYVERGYCEPRHDGRFIHYPHLDGIARTTIFVAREDGKTVGTVSLTLDGPDGLTVDEDFRDECDRIRAEGRVLGVTWRLVTSTVFRLERRVVLALVRAVLARVFELGIRTCLFTVNPRHERIYQRLLNMKTVARKEDTQGLKSAPAVLLRCDYETLPNWCWAIEGGSQLTSFSNIGFWKDWK